MRRNVIGARGWLVMGLGGLVLAGPAMGDTIRWNWQPGDGGISFQDATNWLPQQVPGAADDALFDLSDGITRGTIIDAANAVVDHFDIPSGEWVVTVNAGRTLTATGSFNVRGDHTPRVTLRGDGQYVAHVSAFSSDLSGSSSAFDRCTVTMTGINYDGTGLADVPGKGLFDVGLDGGGAIVIINAGSNVAADYIRVGEGGDETNPSQGNLKVSGAGTRLTAVEGMQVGAGYGWGEFVMDLGAVADIPNVYLANFGPSGLGNAVISGNGTTLNATHASTPGGPIDGGSLVVGDTGRATLILADQARINAYQLIIGNDTTADGQATISNASTRVAVTDVLQVGRLGKALMTVDDAALVTAAGLMVGDQGNLTITAHDAVPGGSIVVNTNSAQGVVTPGVIDVANDGYIRTVGTITGDIALRASGSLHVHAADGPTVPSTAVVNGDILVQTGSISLDLAGLGADLLTVHGIVTFDDGNVDVNVDDSYIPILGQRFELIRADGFVGDPNVYVWNWGGALPEAWWIETDLSDHVLAVTVVPEPATMSLMMLAAAMLLRRRPRAC